MENSTCYWLTGLPGAGKSTLAAGFSSALKRRGINVIVLDGDALRAGLNRDLGFDRESRQENARRIGEVARHMLDQGLTVIVASISPYRADREAARALFIPGTFIEVYVDTNLETCAQRDPKGLYARAKAGKLVGLTGWDAEYEAPLAPEIVTRSNSRTVADSLDILLSFDEGRLTYNRKNASLSSIDGCQVEHA